MDWVRPLGQVISIRSALRRCAETEVQPQIVVRVVARLAQDRARLSHATGCDDDGGTEGGTIGDACLRA